MTLPPSERYLNWIHDPAPPPTRYHGDLASPAPPGNQENSLPQDTSRQLPRRLRPRRRREMKPGSSTNENSASHAADPATQPGSTANRNSAFQEAATAIRPRSAANRNSPFAGNRPGTSGSNRSSLPQWSILRPSCAHSIHSIPDFGPIKIQDADLTWTTLNSGVYINWPSQASSRIQLTDFVETPSPDLASPLLPFSDLIETPSLNRPLGQLNKETSLTDSCREARIAGGSRPGIIYPLPRAARPDTRLEVDAAPPEAAALSRAELPPTVLDIPETERLESPCCPESSQKSGLRLPRRHTHKRPRNRSSGVYRPKKRSPHRGHWCE